MAPTLHLREFEIGTWVFSQLHGESVRILGIERVWNRSIYDVWIPRKGKVERVQVESLAAARPATVPNLDRTAYIAAATRIADALTQDVLLAPLEAGGSLEKISIRYCHEGWNRKRQWYENNGYLDRVITSEDRFDGSIDAAEIEKIARKKILLES